MQMSREALAELAELQAHRALEREDYEGAKLHHQYASIQRWAAKRERVWPPPVRFYEDEE